MKKTTTLIKTFLYRTCVAIGVATLFYGLPNAINATQTVRELFDSLPNNPKVTDGISPALSLTLVVHRLRRTPSRWRNQATASIAPGFKRACLV